MKSRSIFAVLALCVAIASCQSQETTTDDTDSTMMSEPDNTMNNTTGTPDNSSMNADTSTSTTNRDTTSMDTGGGNMR